MNNNDNLDQKDQAVSVHEIIISSEKEAWEVLENYYSAKYDKDCKYRLVITQKGIIQHRAIGDKYHQTITPAMMRAYLELQKNIYKSYALVKYGSNNANKLKQSERDKLEILLKVENGSSKYEHNNSEIIELFNKALSQMDSIHLLILGAIFVTSYFGHAAWKSYLQHRLEVRRKELSNDKDNKTLDHCNFISQEDTKKMQIIERIISGGSPQAQSMLKNARSSYDYLLKGAADAEEFEANGTKISSDIASELLVNSRPEITETRKDGLYRVEKNVIPEQEFIITLRNAANGEMLNAKLEDKFLSEDQIKLLQSAEWERKPVNLKINARIKEDEIVSAYIVGIEEYIEKK